MPTVRATIKVCDNPECGNRFEHSSEEPAPGYHLGKGYWVIAGGGSIPSTYACTFGCIAPAVEAVIERSL